MYLPGWYSHVWAEPRHAFRAVLMLPKQKKI